MKKIIILLIVASAFASGIKAQTDTINYIVVYSQNTGMLGPSQTIAGFKSQVNLANFLNASVDSSVTVTVFDVRTKKPMTATVQTVDVEVVVKQRQRNWKVK